MHTPSDIDLTASPLSKPAPLVFAGIWLAFTSVHAFFMLNAAWGTWALAFLIPLYGVFFGAGFWMLRSWLSWHQLRRRYGNATLAAAPALALGESAAINVQFDRAWQTDALATSPVTGLLRWSTYDSDGDPNGTLHEIALHMQATPLGDRTLLRGSALLPLALPAQVGKSQRVELILRTHKNAGWRFVLPFHAQGDRAAATRAPLSEADAARGKKIMGWVAAAALLAAAGIAASALTANHFSFFRLAFAVPVAYIAYIIWTLRAQITSTQPGADLTQTPESALALRARFTRFGSVITVLMFGSFAADAFMPREITQAITRTLGSVKNSLPISAAAGTQAQPGAAALQLTDQDLQATQRLLGNAASIQTYIQKNGYHPAHFAAMRGQLKTLEFFLAQGVAADAVNSGSQARGETLLMAAARSKTNSTEMMSLLLARGAALGKLDAHGKNATDWAEYFGNANASDFLCARGLEPTALDPGGANNETRKRASCSAPSAARPPAPAQPI